MAIGDSDHNDLQITNRDELNAFLKGRSKEDAVAIALRAAWRALPFISEVEGEALFKHLTLETFRATLIASRNVSAYASYAYAYAIASFTGRASARAVSAVSAARASARTASADSVMGTIVSAARAVSAIDAATYVWESAQNDCQFLASGAIIELITRPLWPEGAPDKIADILAEFDKRLSALDPDWGLISAWYQQILINGAIDPFPTKALDSIANENRKFWGDGDDSPRTSDMIIADIAERVGWGTNTVPEQSASAPDISQSRMTSEKREKLVKTIATNSEDMLGVLSGLVRLVQLERDKIASHHPNSEEGKREVEAQLSWFDQLLDGLEQIKKSLENSTPEKSAERIETVTNRLGGWYDNQADWAKKAVRMTAIGTTAASLFAIGVPSWVSLIVPGMFFAKKEINEIKDMVKKD